ncbi:hypothetical protein ACFYS8_06745 [Kitasatospora sp. NPDC004615]|uniref:hypothetical protein n=1 Tax=Kitasatospora sp. NPDC004615 TaxID=3364017 RepID=UPI00369DD8AF
MPSKAAKTSKFARFALAAAIAVSGSVAATAVTVATAATAQAASSVDGQINRSEVIQRAQYWYGKSIAYDQGGSYGDSSGRSYRTDCSGYVSMAWHLGSSLSTQTLPGVATEISRADLKPGDILNSFYDHVILFEKWDDSAHTTFSYYSFGSTPVKHRTGISINAATFDSHPNGDYKALRYNKIVDDPTVVSANNGSGGRVATGVHADGRLEVFATMADGSVMNEVETSPGGAWSGWYGFALAGAAKSVTTDVHADGRVEVFAVTPNGGMTNRVETAANGAWSGWNGFGPAGTVTNAATARHADGRLEVFTVMNDGSITNEAETAPGGAWSAWNAFASYGTAKGDGSPGALATGVHADGRVEVFAVTPNGGMTNRVETNANGAWSGWNGFGPAGTITAAATARHADGRLEAFTVMNDGSIMNEVETSANGAWSAWSAFASYGTAKS